VRAVAGQRVGAAQNSTVSILIVDDQPAGLIALQAVLEPVGENIVTARSGPEALQHVLRTDFAVILLDVRMPGMDGFETASLIRQREKSASTPIIFLTAALRDDAANRGYALGAVDYLTKPIVAEVLRSKVEVFVELAKKNALLRELNLALAQQAADCAVVNKELESFSYSVSHDLRAPLRAITGFSQLLVENHAGQLDEEGKAYLERIRRAGQRMGELIDDLLGLARVTRAELQRERVDLGKIAREICTELVASEPGREIELSIAAPVWVEADPRLIKLVLENLLSNAFKFTQKVPHPRVEFGVGPTEGGRTYFVRDNGAGFDMAQVNRLFTAFQRLHTAAEFPGTGIGLAIVHRVISRHGGKVWAESAGEGATFRFTLG
jgi:two-component system sensor histidine kinase/response regulator